MRVDPQSGHEPGRVRRARRAKAYPQAMQLAGTTTSRSPRARRDRSRCSRCPATSFSRMETRSDSSRAVAAPRSNSSRIASRIVRVRSTSRGCSAPKACQSTYCGWQPPPVGQDPDVRLFHVWLQPAFALKVFVLARSGAKPALCQMALIPNPLL